ncbi:uncharacterized protein LOC126904840 [Daktulosphaira vitifoliae]|uniref:uncharacterized protein LOC126904840 n=1 Tax=Daktulosphaira vitifoliae TaxID=58002 RepID=UPI0021AA32D8|nr:uncharacterized protein LOC126904840 [Daktulosphaira vitifoliae]
MLFEKCNVLFIKNDIKVDLEATNLFTRQVKKKFLQILTLSKTFTVYINMANYVLLLNSFILDSQLCIGLWLLISVLLFFINIFIFFVDMAIKKKFEILTMEFIILSIIQTCISIVFRYLIWKFHKTFREENSSFKTLIEKSETLSGNISIKNSSQNLNALKQFHHVKIKSKTTLSSHSLGPTHPDDEKFLEVIRQNPDIGLPLTEEIIDWIFKEIYLIENETRDETTKSNKPIMLNMAKRADKFLKLTPQEIIDRRNLRIQKTDLLKKMSSKALPRTMPVLNNGSLSNFLEKNSEEELRTVEMADLEEQVSQDHFKDLPMSPDVLFGIFFKYYHNKQSSEESNDSSSNHMIGAKNLTKNMNYMPNITPHLTKNNTTNVFNNL